MREKVLHFRSKISIGSELNSLGQFVFERTFLRNNFAMGGARSDGFPVLVAAANRGRFALRPGPRAVLDSQRVDCV